MARSLRAKRGRPKKQAEPAVQETPAESSAPASEPEVKPSETPALAPVEGSTPLEPTDMTKVIEESAAAIAEAAPKKKRGRKPGTSAKKQQDQIQGLGVATLKNVLSTPFLILSVQTEVPEAMLTEEEATELAQQGVFAAQAAGVDLQNPRVALWAFVASFGMVALGKGFAVYQARKGMKPAPVAVEAATENSHSEEAQNPDQPDFFGGKGLKL